LRLIGRLRRFSPHDRDPAREGSVATAAGKRVGFKVEGSCEMRNRFLGSIIAGVAVCGALALAPAASAQSAPAIPRTPDGKPDFTGYWNLPYMPDLAFRKEAEVPYTPAGAAAFKNHDAKDDPTGLCLPPGMPRLMHSPFPMEIYQKPNELAMLFEYMRIWRIIDLSGKPHNTDTGVTFMGDSTGKWEGYTLVI
jgi:hypothetical protein